MLKLEIADTPTTQERGLMYRKAIPDDSGMVFIFNKPQKLHFWGANTYVPLDIAFISKDLTIKKISHIQKLNKNTVSSDQPCIMAIEVNHGYFSKNNINVGDRVVVNDLSHRNKLAKISFEQGINKK